MRTYPPKTIKPAKVQRRYRRAYSRHSESCWDRTRRVAGKIAASEGGKVTRIAAQAQAHAVGNAPEQFDVKALLIR